MSNSVSPAQVNEYIQELLNKTAGAQNYELEKLTTSSYEFILHVESILPASQPGLSNYYLLFNAWIRWLADWKNYSTNLMHRRRLIGHLNKQLGVNKYSLQIYPYAARYYTIKPVKGSIQIQLHECFDWMQEQDCYDFALNIRRRSWNDLKSQLTVFYQNNQSAREIFDFFQQTKANPTHANQTRGRYYDLEEVFNNCNRRNFGGKMPRPAVLHWSPKVNRATMGSYKPQEDSLMINKGLDAKDVPAYVLDFIMYHELLHKALGVKTSGNRRMAHTKEFRQLEEAHPDYERAEAFLKKRYGSR